MMIGAEKLCHAPRVRQLIVIILGRSALKSDRVGAYRLRAVRRHESNHGTRVDAAGQECTDRDVAYHLHAHRLRKPRTHALDPFRLGSFPLDGAGNAPVAALFDMFSLRDDQACRRQFSDATENRMRCGDVPEINVRMQCRAIDVCGDPRQREERLGLGGEREALAVLQHVNGLDAQAIATDDEPSVTRVP